MTGRENAQDILVDVQHLTKSFVADANFFGRPTSYVHGPKTGEIV